MNSQKPHADGDGKKQGADNQECYPARQLRFTFHTASPSFSMGSNSQN